MSLISEQTLAIYDLQRMIEVIIAALKIQELLPRYAMARLAELLEPNPGPEPPRSPLLG